MDSIEFLRTVFGNNEGFLFISTKSSPSDTEITIHKPFQYPANLNTIRTYLSMREDEDVYFSPMLYSVPRRRASSVSHTPVLYADTDAFPVDQFLIPPSINIETSPGRHASLWLLDGEYPPDAIAQASRAIALTHASRGENGEQVGTDTGGWDLTQLLRMPNSLNLKYQVTGKYHGYEKPYQVTVDEGTSPFTIYSLDEITSTYDPANLPAMPERASMDMPDEDDLPEMKDVIRRVIAIRNLATLYEKKPASNEDRSQVLYHFVCECLRAGFTAEETFVVGWYAASNKYRIDGRPRDDFWTYDMRKALADPANRPRSTLEELADDTYLHPEDEGLYTEVEFQLLDEDQFPTKTFVDEYVAWASSKTDAPSQYHVASALTILSCVFGEWGTPMPKYGPLNLGLSFVVMGETTETRKSTARKLMKQVLGHMQDDNHFYMLTSDATEEALIDALNERANMSSLYDRDEAQKLIADVKGGKGYMKGFLETLNELYDGHARGRLRAGKQTKGAPVVFSQYLMGIRSQIQENLELSDFASGWGPRQIWIRGETNTDEETLLAQQSENDRGGYHDEVLERMVANLRRTRGKWESLTNGDRANPFALFADDDAWTTLVTVKKALKTIFKDHPRYDTLTPCFERLQTNGIKVAALLTMAEGRERIIMQDAINTRAYVARWVEDLVIMVEGVNQSLYARDIKKFEDFIGLRGGLVTTNLAIKYVIEDMGKGYRDYEEYVKVLVDRGVIIMANDANKKPSIRLVSGD